MTPTERNRVKNAPLAFREDRSNFVEWATSVSDGSISAGWQSLPPHLANPAGLRGGAERVATDASRRSLAKFVELSRRQLGHSLEQLAEKADVGLAELLAVETGEGIVHSQTVQRLATFLGVNPQKLLQLAGLAPTGNHNLEQAALQFAARTESVKPLEPQEQAALERFCDEVFAVE
jgi:transcriptional regulator with XRE-family HTH domain